MSGELVTNEQMNKFLSGPITMGPDWILLATVHPRTERPCIIFSCVEMRPPYRTGEQIRLPITEQTWIIIRSMLSRGLVQNIHIRICNRNIYLPVTEHKLMVEKFDAILGGSIVAERLISLTKAATTPCGIEAAVRYGT